MLGLTAAVDSLLDYQHLRPLLHQLLDPPRCSSGCTIPQLVGTKTTTPTVAIETMIEART
jgi:hypothetical protein